MLLRIERFGAWARLETLPLVIALDRAAVTRLGIDGGEAWSDRDTWSNGEPLSDGVPSSDDGGCHRVAARSTSAPLEVHLAVSSRCSVGCEGCYLDARPDGVSPPFDELVTRLASLARAGVFTVAFGGGEPLSRDDLGALAHEARRLGLAPVTTTSGAGMTAERARELRAFDQVNVSYDGDATSYGLVRGVAGSRMAERAMEMLRDAGVRFGINLTLTRQSFVHVDRVIARARDLGACEVQVLRFKPGGRAAGEIYETRRLDPAQAREVPPLLSRLIASGVSVRIDCSMMPWLAGVFTIAELVRNGVWGCEAARHLSAVDVKGKVAPCSFLPASHVDAHDLGDGVSRTADDVLRAARTLPTVMPCAGCDIREVCRGGCRAVAAHHGDPGGPDPECPRVVAWRRDHHGEDAKGDHEPSARAALTAPDVDPLGGADAR